MNRLIIDMDRILATKGREADIILEPGDRIYIPTVPSGVSVMGSVSANGTIKYVSRKERQSIMSNGPAILPARRIKNKRA